MGLGPWLIGRRETVVRDVPVTFSSLRIFFKDAASGKRVYQITARNTTEGGSLAGVMPYMIRSALTEFPSENGRPRRVTLEVDKDKIHCGAAWDARWFTHKTRRLPHRGVRSFAPDSRKTAAGTQAQPVAKWLG